MTDTRSANRIDDVLSVLHFAEEKARCGSHVAVMLSYEAAPAFDSAFVTHEPTDFPLAWARVFTSKSEAVAATTLSNSTNGWSPRVSRDDYDCAVARIRELIAAGDTYQVNYSFPLASTFSGDTFAWYRDLCVAQGAQYSVYLDLGRYKVLCLSPELFFERRGNRVIARPMKGTIRRGRWASEDRELAQRLRDSAKDRAENVMIVDLLRNDLGKVSVPGSVCVWSLFDIERFETVWQMTSTVEAKLTKGTSLVELMAALFPCGSITGAPKIRTMQIIRELEPFPRGVYTGTIGFLRPGGDCVFNVAIRTVVVDTETNVATFGVGGGVTSDSTAEREYEECLVKSRFLHESPQDFQLFESILLENGEYFLLPDHLERFMNSAAYFGFAFPEEKICSLLKHIAANNAAGAFKVRVTLWKDGQLETDTSPLERGANQIRHVRLATKPVDSSDRFLFHKTTRRDGYSDDVILWNERGEVTESGIANLVVEIDRELVTPPISSGLLAGTFRNYLLAQEKIKERVISIEELQTAKRLYLINSVRRFLAADNADT
ncbi:MAG TPA: aminodeoxychorismate synthase component I [Pyrinomonadaceae bacterium]|nr:aminodeoxychorismate synthase component I [Pyrinomonadaceae bacterium]